MDGRGHLGRSRLRQRAEPGARHAQTPFLQAGCCAPRLTTPLAARQIIEVRNDSLMKRTQRRPLPAGAMSRHHAIAFAVCAGVSGVAILYTQVRALTRSVTCVALG